jgi:hypothetical protein
MPVFYEISGGKIGKATQRYQLVASVPCSVATAFTQMREKIAEAASAEFGVGLLPFDVTLFDSKDGPPIAKFRMAVRAVAQEELPI